MALTKVTAGVIAANAVVDSFGSQSITGDKIGLKSISANNIEGIVTVTSGVGVFANNSSLISPYKILGQVQPGANALTTIYTVPASTNTIVQTITICNQSANNLTVNVAANISGDAVTTKNYLITNYNLEAAETLVLEPRLAMLAGSLLSANITGANAASNVSVNAYGVEII